MKKKCSKCGLVKAISKFNKRKASKDGHTAKCNTCLKAYALKMRTDEPEFVRSKNLKSRFNMSIDDYNKIFLNQKGKCAICGNSETTRDKKGSVKWLSVDHNHDTGDIRGLLCHGCNTGIGKLGDSVKTLKSAIDYLNKRGSYGK